MPTRLKLLSDFVTRFIFNNVSRGLFEEHKLLYAFLVATSILRHPSRCGVAIVSSVQPQGAWHRTCLCVRVCRMRGLRA